jgi:hypothetical protein
MAEHERRGAPLVVSEKCVHVEAADADGLHVNDDFIVVCLRGWDITTQDQRFGPV